MTRWLAALAALLLLGGCSWLPFGGGDEPESEAERLVRPPDILSQGTVGAAPVGEAGEGDRIRVEQRDEARDPAALLDRVNGQPVLDVGLPPGIAWRVTGRVLQRSAFAVESRNVEAGSYTLRYAAAEEPPEEGFLASLAFWRDDPVPPIGRYRLEVTPLGNGSRLRLLTAEGEPANPGVARQVLAVLAERLRP